jgi:hypothetical protein
VYGKGRKAIDLTIQAFTDDDLDNMEATYVCLMEFKLEQDTLEKRLAAEEQLHQRFEELVPTSRHRCIIGIIVLGKYFKAFLVDCVEMTVLPPFQRRDPRYTSCLADQEMYLNNPYVDWTTDLGSRHLCQVFADVVGIGLGARMDRDVNVAELTDGKYNCRLNGTRYRSLYATPTTQPGKLLLDTPSTCVSSLPPASQPDNEETDPSYKP